MHGSVLIDVSRASLQKNLLQFLCGNGSVSLILQELFSPYNGIRTVLSSHQWSLSESFCVLSAFGEVSPLSSVVVMAAQWLLCHLIMSSVVGLLPCACCNLYITLVKLSTSLLPF